MPWSRSRPTTPISIRRNPRPAAPRLRQALILFSAGEDRRVRLRGLSWRRRDQQDTRNSEPGRTDPKYIVAAVKAYKSGGRKNDMMKTLVSALTDAELDDIALYFALQKPGKAKTSSPGNQSAGKSAAVACAGCHRRRRGEHWDRAPPRRPGCAVSGCCDLKDYKDGVRSDQLMKAPAASVDAGTVKDLAAYYANQIHRSSSTKVRMPLTTDEMAQRCDRCHGVNGNSTARRFRHSRRSATNTWSG